MSFLDADNIPMAESVTFEFAGEAGVWAPIDPSKLDSSSTSPFTRAQLRARFLAAAPADPPPAERYVFHLYPISSQLQAPVVRYQVRNGQIYLVWVAFAQRNRTAVESVEWPFGPSVEIDRHMLFLRFDPAPVLSWSGELELARCQESVDISCYLRRDGPLEADRVLAAVDDGW